MCKISQAKTKVFDLVNDREYSPELAIEAVTEEFALTPDEVSTLKDELVYGFANDDDDEEDEDNFLDDGMTDVEADADVLRMVGWGTDEDYGYNGDEGWN